MNEIGKFAGKIHSQEGFSSKDISLNRKNRFSWLANYT